MRIQISWPVALIVSAQLLVPTHTLSLLDSGESLETDKAESKVNSARQDREGHVAAVNQQKTYKGTLVVPDETHVGITHACRRSTDFFQHLCNRPLGASAGDGSQDYSNVLAPTVTADLLVCDVPKIEPLLRPDSDAQTSQKAPSATYAVSGTVVIHAADSDVSVHSLGLPEIGDTTAASTNDKAPAHEGTKETTYPGPNDEGFWRQRDGRHEWHPASGLITSLQGPDREKKNGDKREPMQADVKSGRFPEPPHNSEYDAWSAEQEQGAFLSFNEWKELHAQNPSASVRDLHSSTARKASQDTSTQVQSPSPNATPRRTGSDGDHVHGEWDKKQLHTSSTQLSTPSEISTAPGGPSTTTTAPEDSPSPNTDVSSGQSSSADSSDAPVAKQANAEQVGFSVASGDTSAQLSKLKHRWNFASLDCAAVVHRTNPEAKFASSILSEKKDRYMLSPCPQPSSKVKGASQFVIVELCEEIKIDTIVLANYEFFSNMFKKFTVTAARQLTGRESDWAQLGVFRARNVRGQQVFRIPSAPRSEAFFRYVRIDFLEHFGSEFYCPVSLLRVYGITEMEEYKREFEAHDADPDSIPEVIGAIQNTVDDAQVPALDPLPAVPQPESLLREPYVNLDAANLTARDEDIWRKHEQAFQRKLQNQSVVHDVAETELTEVATPQLDLVSPPATPQPGKAPLGLSQLAPASSHGNTVDDVETAQCAIEDDPSLHRYSRDRCIVPRRQLRPFHHLETAALHYKQLKRQKLASDPSPHVKTNGSLKDAPTGVRQPVASAEADVDVNRGRRPSVQRAPGTPQAHGNPGTESVYRAIHRRLNALESNATLSHSYIEHSGQMLREVFARMERRQELRMSDMLRALNTSNWQQIESLKRRQHVDLQRAIFEFDVHRQQADTERRALLREVHILAEEVLLEKRLSIAQLVLLLVVFVFVGMTRGSRTVPLLHSGFARIRRSSKRREAMPDGKLVLPTSPRRDSARMEQSFDARQAHSSPLRTETPSQGRSEAKPGSATSPDLATQNMRLSAEAVTPARKNQSSSLTPNVVNKVVSPKAATSLHSKAAAKVAVGSLSGRSRLRGETLVGILSHPRTRGRLVILLETLDALDRIADRRGLQKDPVARPVVGRRKAGEIGMKGAPALHPELGLLASAAPGEVRRISRAHRPSPAAKQEHVHTGIRRLVTPAQNRTAALSGFDDFAGMSSDWTERSENGEVSENAASMSDDNERDIKTSGAGLFSFESTFGSRSEAPLGQDGVTKIRPLSPTKAHSVTRAEATLPAKTSRTAQSEEGPLKTRQLQSHDATTMSSLPSITKADGRLSSSDSESEGGAWHKVLPRRIGNGSSLRRARQNTIDGKANKSDVLPKTGVKAEAPDRRDSPRPSLANAVASKSQRAGLTRLFRSGTSDFASLESPQSRRSGTPDTIRDVRPM
ncbi:hypothetical protein NDA12_004431 [Ustilago hordei]|nr:hypothetical protein NDA12_004431 [Ustilago hordei]KAJ1592348.1 hypothetical protein NDA15_000201 [Ustilago hordei]